MDSSSIKQSYPSNVKLIILISIIQNSLERTVQMKHADRGVERFIGFENFESKTRVLFCNISYTFMMFTCIRHFTQSLVVAMKIALIFALSYL